MVESKARKAICTRCGQTSNNLHQNRWHLVKDLSVSGQKTYLKVNRRQWKCKICGRPFSEELKIKAITNSKYVLLKNKEDLTETENIKLKEIENNFPKLKRMYGDKERIRKIYEMAKNWEEGLEEIGKWLNKARDLFPKSSRTIRNWIGEIVSYFDNRTTQGRVEGINNKIKLVKRLAYGFRNFDNFCVRVLLDWYLKTDLAY